MLRGKHALSRKLSADFLQLFIWETADAINIDIL
jgi:hypothetical protein